MTRIDWIVGIFFGIVGACAVLLTWQLYMKIRTSTLINRTFKHGKEWMESSWLAGLPSTNFKSFTTVVLYFGTFVAWMLAVLLEKNMDWDTFGMWLAFLAGLGGFSLAQFNTQRKTDWGAMKIQADIERAKRSGAPDTVGTTINAPSASEVKVETPPPPQGG